jgi:hypothetical protein
MKYNIEKINEIGKLLAEIVEEGLAGRRREDIRIADVEKEVRERLREVGQSAVINYLEKADREVETEIECKCGGKLKYQRRRAATIWSVFGKMMYERAYYAGCVCGKGCAILDERYGIEPGKVTAGLAQLLALSGIDKSFEEGQEWLKAFLLFEVSENTIRSETQVLGELQRKMEEEWIKEMQNEAALQKREQLVVEQVPDRLYGSIDAAKVRIEPRAKQGKKEEVEEDWRDMKIVCWYEGELVPNRQRSVRQKIKAQREGTVFRAKNKQYACDIAEAEQFGKLLWASGCSVFADRVPELVFVCDGATWIWKLISHYYPNAIQIVDWYHAEERLERIAEEAFSDLGERQPWLEKITEALWQGNIECVMEACQSLSKKSALAKQALTYFNNNKERMRYAQFRAAGYLIGSGVIESGCKQIVSRRLKLPGAQWNLEGAILTAKARCVWLSGRWQELISKRSLLPLAI